MQYTVYKKDSNEVVKLVTCPQEDIASQINPELEFFTEGHVEFVAETNKERDIRRIRDHLLFQSDWTQVSDVPVDKNSWAKYRQELRDISLQPQFPDNVVWPTLP